jgi:hypothetical protein
MGNEIYEYVLNSVGHKPIICKDGVSLSMQVGSSLYSTPREARGPYTAVEVGFITDNNGNPVTPPDTWREYSDGEFPSDVYGYVPVELVAEFIDAHGGIDTLAMLRTGFIRR